MTGFTASSDAHLCGLQGCTNLGVRIFQEPHKTGDSFLKDFCGGDQTGNQETIIREIVEVARIHNDVVFLEKVDNQVFVRPSCGNAQNGVPAPGGVEEFASGL
jgi:hypothetical protein